MRFVAKGANLASSGLQVAANMNDSRRRSKHLLRWYPAPRVPLLEEACNWLVWGLLVGHCLAVCESTPRSLRLAPRVVNYVDFHHTALVIFLRTMIYRQCRMDWSSADVAEIDRATTCWTPHFPLASAGLNPESEQPLYKALAVATRSPGIESRLLQLSPAGLGSRVYKKR